MRVHSESPGPVSSLELWWRGFYKEIESNHLRTNSKSSKQRSIEQLHTLRTTFRNRWLLELERMLADRDRYHMASDERKTRWGTPKRTRKPKLPPPALQRKRRRRERYRRHPSAPPIFYRSIEKFTFLNSVNHSH